MLNAVSKTIRCPMCGNPLPSGTKLLRPRILQVCDLILNPATHDVSRAGKGIVLSLTQFRLLTALMQHSGQAVTRSALAHSVWNSGSKATANLVHVTVYQLRKKVDSGHKIKLLKTVAGLGYAIRDPRSSGLVQSG